MATGKRSECIPRLYIKKSDSLKTIYAKARKAFTAADLAKYAVEEEGIPAEDVIRMLDQEVEKSRRSKARKVK